MEIKHTHPVYPDEESRRSALQDRQRICLVQIRRLRDKPSRQA